MNDLQTLTFTFHLTPQEIDAARELANLENRMLDYALSRSKQPRRVFNWRDMVTQYGMSFRDRIPEALRQLEAVKAARKAEVAA